MRNSLIFLIFLAPFMAPFVDLQADAAPAGPLIKHLSSLLKWTRSSPKSQPQTDENVLQFENGYLVETVVEGNELGVIPHSIRVSEDGELFAVDALNNKIVRITPPLSQYSRARLVAGSFQGYAGHVDGKPSDARFNHPKGVTMDDKGNVYVADTSNLAIRKIGESGVTTIAGGKSNVAGYRDGPSEDAKFSNDFDVVYVGRTCSLLVVDRGNAALRQISLNQEDCDYQHSSISTTDIILVIGAVLVGYATCLIQQGYGPSTFLRTEASDGKFQKQAATIKPTPIVEPMKEDPDAGWPSFSRLLTDLSKLVFEAFGSIFFYTVPLSFRPGKSKKKDLTPIRDSLVMPGDNNYPKPTLAQKQRTATPVSETRHVRPTTPLSETRHVRTTTSASEARSPNVTEGYSQHKLQKSKSATLKDPSLSSKYRSSKRQDSTELYGSSETSPAPPPYGQFSSKSQKERTRYRQRDRSGEVRSGEVVFKASGSEPKPAELKPGEYSDGKFDGYIRNKYGSDSLFNF